MARQVYQEEDNSKRGLGILYDSQFKDFKGKLYSRWMGPYEVDKAFENGTVRMVTIDEEHTPLIENGHRLRIYHKPTSKASFFK